MSVSEGFNSLALIPQSVLLRVCCSHQDVTLYAELHCSKSRQSFSPWPYRQWLERRVVGLENLPTSDFWCCVWAFLAELNFLLWSIWIHPLLWIFRTVNDSLFDSFLQSSESCGTQLNMSSMVSLHTLADFFMEKFPPCLFFCLMYLISLPVTFYHAFLLSDTASNFLHWHNS